MNIWISRSQMLFKFWISKIFAIFTGKHLCWSAWRPATLLKTVSNIGVSEHLFFIERLRWLLLNVINILSNHKYKKCLLGQFKHFLIREEAVKFSEFAKYLIERFCAQCIYLNAKLLQGKWRPNNKLEEHSLTVLRTCMEKINSSKFSARVNQFTPTNLKCRKMSFYKKIFNIFLGTIVADSSKCVL